MSEIDTTRKGTMRERFMVFWRRPLTQALLVGFVLFCCPGMLNAIQGIGAGGSRASETSLVAKGNAALYSCFAVFGIFSGSVINTIGPKIPLMLGGIGYALYIGSLWCLAEGGPDGFVIASGAILGTTAALLWASQGVVVMSYPLESERAITFAMQWSLLNIGAALGGLITLIQTLKSGNAEAVGTGTYVAFIVIVLVGIASSTTLVSPRNVYRKDGTPVMIESTPTWREELKGLLAVTTDWKILILTPAFLASNWFYAYQFALNAAYFSLRSRALNSMMYWLFQMFGSFAISGVLDYKGWERRTRGLVGLSIVFIFVMGTWIGGAIFQTTFTRADAPLLVDWVDPGWGGPFALYCLWGVGDSMFQTYCYWIMSALTNDPRRLARYAGWYKGWQSAGAAISFGINAVEIPYIAEMAICFALQGGTILLVFIVALTITDTNYGKEDTVVPPIDLVKTVGEKNAVHAGPGARLGRGGEGEGDDEVTVTGTDTGQEGEMVNDQSGKKY